MKRLVLASLAAVVLAGCSAGDTGAPAPAQPPVGPYIVVISEPSQNIPKDDTSHLIAYWSCAPDADPRTWSPHGFHSLPIGTMSPDEYHARRRPSLKRRRRTPTPRRYAGPSSGDHEVTRRYDSPDAAGY